LVSPARNSADPLHDLDARKARLDWADVTTYQMAEVAFQVIDQVTIAMDFDHGAKHDEVISRVLPFVAAQVPDRVPDEHAQVARWVLDNLINVGTLERGFRSVYGAFGATGGYERRAFDFKLLIELASGDGTVYLRASDEAINVLVGALDTDVESAQIAAEIKLDNLIKRGKLSDAQAAAQQARYRTVQYAETLRRKLEATRRDVRAVDWEHDVPDLIDSALTHIGERYRAENAILDNIRRARDEAEDPRHKRRAANLVEIVRDCINRHAAAGQVDRSRHRLPRRAGPAAVLRPRAAGHGRPVRAAARPDPRPAATGGESPDRRVLPRYSRHEVPVAAAAARPGPDAVDPGR
jgi:hypothetical protein